MPLPPHPLPLRHIPWALALLLLAAAPAAAIERPQVSATRATGTIRVDGILDEPDWARAAPIGHFVQIENREGEAPSESTEVRILLDDGHLYLGARCWNRGPGGIRATLAPRDYVTDQDLLTFHIDTYRDMRRAYAFGVTPYGVQLDGLLDGNNLSVEWDGIWKAETTRDRDGWTAEIEIPFRSMRFAADGRSAWGFWIRRQITKNDEVVSWPIMRNGEAGAPMLQAGDVTGFEDARGAGTMDLQPYAASTWSSQRTPGASGGSSRWDDERARDMGVDLRIPLSATMVANATVNPDFSQIEADALQIDVNQRYPLYFAEKRPFFLEGADLFSTPFELVYTRRIADPAYGAKVTGGIGHLRLGGVVVRDDGGGSLSGVGGATGFGPSTTPRGWYHIARLSYDVGDNSRVGLLMTAHQGDGRLLVAYSPFGAAVSLDDGGQNVVLAADAKLRLSKAWFFTGQLASSRSRFDRLEADTTQFVPFYVEQQTRRNDVAYIGQFTYTDGIRDLSAYHQYVGPDFRSEAGFVRRVDARKTAVNSDFYWRPENAWLRSVEPILNSYVLHDRSGRVQEWWVSPMIDWKLRRQTHVHTMVERTMERWIATDHLKTIWTLVVENSQWRGFDFSADLVVGDGIYYAPTAAGSFLGWSEVYDASATLRPSPRFTSAPTLTRLRFSRDHGHGELFDVWVWGVKNTYQFTRRLYARVYPQYDTASEHLDADALLGYVLHPGSVVYLGVNGDGERVRDRLQNTGRSVFFKVSYVFQR